MALPLRRGRGKGRAIKEKKNSFELFFLTVIKLEGRGGRVKALMLRTLKKDYLSAFLARCTHLGLNAGHREREPAPAGSGRDGAGSLPRNQVYP